MGIRERFEDFMVMAFLAWCGWITVFVGALMAVVIGAMLGVAYWWLFL